MGKGEGTVLSLQCRWIQQRRRLHQRAALIPTIFTFIILSILARITEPNNTLRRIKHQVQAVQDSSQGTQETLLSNNSSTNRIFISTIDF